MSAGGEVRSESQEEIAKFLQEIMPAALELKTAGAGCADATDGLLQDKGRAHALSAFQDARSKFESTVEEKWPFDSPGPGESDAGAAYREADKFVRSMYRTRGQATRDEAAEKYAEVAKQFPGTVAHDRALFMQANLYLQGLCGGAKRDPAKAKEIFEKLAASESPCNTSVLWAEENLAGHSPDAEKRMGGRSEFHLATRMKVTDDEWLRKDVLTPKPEERPAEYAKRVVGFMVQAQAVQFTNGKNMVADAVNTANPLESLNWLKKRHAGDAFIEGEVDAAIKYVMRREFEHDS